MTHGSLFSGIGGFELAAKWMGWDNIFHCEWNEFGQKVLKHHFPKSISYADITKTDFSIHRGTIDILTGGFPCQPYSAAGKRLGKEDERHLWPEMLRAIREIQPKWIVGENVLGLVNWSGGLVFEEVQTDLETQGYEVQAYVLPAASVGAPHKRDRVWFIAHAKDNGCRGRKSEQCAMRKREFFQREQTGSTLGCEVEGCSREWTITDTNNDRSSNGFRQVQGKNGKISQRNYNAKSCNTGSSFERFPTKSPICNGDDGLSDRLDTITFPKWRNESIKAGGNAIVPQVAHQIFKAIQEYEQHYGSRL